MVTGSRLIVVEVHSHPGHLRFSTSEDVYRRVLGNFGSPFNNLFTPHMASRDVADDVPVTHSDTFDRHR